MNRSKTVAAKCFVPFCTNTTTNSPEKLFVNVSDNGLRARWCHELNIAYSRTKRMFCCSNHFDMWPLLMAFIRRNVPFLTLPFAAVVGVIGYNIESLVSDKYTPYNKPVQDQRQERQLEELLKDPTQVDKLKYKENVLGKNVSPSLQNSQ